MNKDDYCNKLAVIPQFSGTCWFNAILMVCFYSQGVRELSIKYSNKWSKKDSLFNFFRKVLKHSYDVTNKSFFDKIKPEVIILKIMKSYDTYLRHVFNSKNLKNEVSIKWGGNIAYIMRFLKHLQIPTLYLNTILTHKGIQIIVNYPLLYYYYVNYDNNKFAYLKFNNNIDEIKNTIKNVPEILIINDLFDIEKSYKLLSSENNLNGFFDENLNINNKNTNYKSIDNKEEIIVFNNVKYKLDAVLLKSYNPESHAIAGITCNNNKFVYNGWNKYSADPAFEKKNEDEMMVNPCTLMKYDWDINKSNPFCLNPYKCQLDNAYKDTELCFNFGKLGSRMLIYVRINDDNERKNNLKYNSKDFSDISNKRELIYEVYKINNLKTMDIYNLIQIIIEYSHSYDYIIFKHFSKLLKIILRVLNLLNVKNNFKYIKERLINYNNNTESELEKKSDLIYYYYKAFYYREYEEHKDIFNVYVNILKEINTMFPDYKIPEFTSPSDVSKILFDFYKIKGDSYVIDNLLKNNVNKLTMPFMINFLLVYVKYFENTITKEEKKEIISIIKEITDEIFYLSPEDKEKKPKETTKVTKITKVKEDKKEKKPKETTKVIKITKPELIANIKKFNPLIKGLTTKNKDELLEIYNKLKK
jgi:hypothetical protein